MKISDVYVTIRLKFSQEELRVSRLGMVDHVAHKVVSKMVDTEVRWRDILVVSLLDDSPILTIEVYLFEEWDLHKKAQLYKRVKGQGDAVQEFRLEDRAKALYIEKMDARRFG